ncbi:MAG: GH25 family lysozyme [Pseudomonadota bacterium]
MRFSLVLPALAAFTGCTLFQHTPNVDEAGGDCPIAIQVEGWAELDLREHGPLDGRWVGEEFHEAWDLPEGSQNYAYVASDTFALTGAIVSPRANVDEASFIIMDMYSHWVGSDRDETIVPPEDGRTRYAYDRASGSLWALRSIKSENDSYEHPLEVTELLVTETAEGPIIYLEYIETYYQGEDGGSCTSFSTGDGRGSDVDTSGGSSSGGSSSGGHDGNWSACGDEVIGGIDVSYWQGTIDWNKAANDGLDFAIVRIGDGFYEDPKFEENWQGARNNGLVRGSYQYFRASQDPVAQAEIVARKLGSMTEEDIPAVLDIETTDGVSTSHVADAMHDWLDTVERETGRVPIIYTSPGLWPSMVGSEDFSEYPLWVAHWGTSCPTLPTHWDHWVFWQTSSDGAIDGISGRVDTDVFNGSLDDLYDWVADH